MIIEMLTHTNPIIVYEGIVFRFELFINAPDDIRICYAILYVEDTSKHYKEYQESGSWYNPFVSITPKEPHLCSFLYLQGGIETDEECAEALRKMQIFLYEKLPTDDERAEALRKMQIFLNQKLP